MIKLVGFDLDGTIGDTIPLCLGAYQKAVGPYLQRDLTEEEIKRAFGLNEEGMTRLIVGDDWEKALNDFNRAYEQMHFLCPRPFDGIAELIGDLKKNGLLVALITGKGEDTCAITLKQFGLQECFDRIETGSPDRNRKAEAMDELLEHYGLHPDEMVYIGDVVSDITACREAGVTCLSAAWASSALPFADQLEALNPGNVIHSVGELRDRLEKKKCIKL